MSVSYTINDEFEVEADRVPCLGEVIVHRMSEDGHDRGAVVRLHVDRIEWNVTGVRPGSGVARAWVYASEVGP